MWRMKKKKPRQPKREIPIAFVSEPSHPELDRAHWIKHKLHELAEGYTLRPLGRAIVLFYRHGGGIIEFQSEISGTPEFDILIFIPEAGLAWIDPITYEQRPLTPLEMQAELERLNAWLKSRGIRASI